MDAMGGPMKHGPQAEPAFERAPGLFHTLPLLVPQGQGGRREAIAVALEHQLPLATGFRPSLRGVKPQAPACGHPERTTVAAARPPLPHALGMPFIVARAEGRQVGVELPQELLPMGSLPGLFRGVGTHHITPPTVPLAHAHVLDPQVARAGLLTPGALQDLARHLVTTAQGHTQGGCAPTLPELGERLWRGHARIAHKHPPTQLPPPAVVLAGGDGAHTHGMARTDPVPHGHPLARHRHPPHKWRGSTTAVFRQAALRRRRARWRRRAAVWGSSARPPLETMRPSERCLWGFHTLSASCRWVTTEPSARC
jgi:hypothetical protein